MALTEQQVIKLKARCAVAAEEVLAYAGEPLMLERPWQYDLVSSTNMYEIWSKSRQIGFSWAIALRCVVRAMLFPPNSYNAVIVSINREESIEKIRYANQFWENIPKNKRVEIDSSPQSKIVFKNGNTIRSYPGRAVRGTPQTDLILDEFAHVRDAQTVYQGSTASTIRSYFGVTIGSTPYGRGLFKNIFQGAGVPGEYSQYVSHFVPWWESHELCLDVAMAKIFAPGMRTEERVRRYGTPRLIQEFEGQSLEIFQQEFEAFFFDSANSVLTEEKILAVSDGMLEMPVHIFACGEETVRQELEDNIRIIIQEIRSKGLSDLVMGMDLGKEANATEIILLKQVGAVLQTCAYLTLRNCPWLLQELVFKMLMSELPIRKAVIDSSGSGRGFGDDMKKAYTNRVESLVYGDILKEVLVSGLIKCFDNRTIKIYSNKRMFIQLLSVKKVYSDNGKVRYKSMYTKEEKDVKAHADQFWALAMAIYGADCFEKSHIVVTTRSPILVPRRNSGGGIGVGVPRNFNNPSRG